MAGNDGEAAAQQAEAAAGEDARRRPCREGEGAGLGAKSKDDDARKLPTRRIEAALTEAGESAATELGGGGRRRSPAALQGGRRGRVRGKIEG